MFGTRPEAIEYAARVGTNSDTDSAQTSGRLDRVLSPSQARVPISKSISSQKKKRRDATPQIHPMDGATVTVTAEAFSTKRKEAAAVEKGSNARRVGKGATRRKAEKGTTTGRKAGEVTAAAGCAEASDPEITARLSK